MSRQPFAPRTRPAPASKRFRPGMLPLEGRALLATITVTSAADAGAGSLRQAIADSASGGTVAFAPALRGSTITLTSGPLSIAKDLTIQGPGAGSLTLSGGGKGGIFAIAPANAGSTATTLNVAINWLTLAKGAAANGGAIDATQTNLSLSGDALVNDSTAGAGGAIRIQAGSNGTDSNGQPVPIPGSLVVTGSTFRGDQSAEGGGAIYIGGTPATLTSDTFASNTTQGFGGAIYSFDGAPGVALAIQNSVFAGNSTTNSSFALGGAIENEGTTTISGSLFEYNMAVGPNDASGGVIHGEFGSTLTVTGSTFAANQARATSGSAYGGAIADDPGSSLTVANSTFSANLASGRTDTTGGAISNFGGTNSGYSLGLNGPGTTISGSLFTGNRAVGIDVTTGNGGDGGGGAVSSGNGFLKLSNSRFLGNLAQGGSGGTTAGGGVAEGGGVVDVDEPFTVTGSTFVGNVARGGSGTGADTFAYGGGFNAFSYVGSAALTISSSQFVGNSAIGGSGTVAATGSLGGGGGVALQASSPVNFVNDVIGNNSAIGGAGGPTGGTGGAGQGGGVQVSNSSITITGGRIFSNIAQGGKSKAGAAGAGQGGGVYSGGFNGMPGGSLTVNGVAVTGDYAIGGSGLSGGNGEGGGLWADGILGITQTQINGNRANGGSAGKGLGGGVFLGPNGKSTVDSASKIVANFATTAGPNTYPS